MRTEGSSTIENSKTQPATTVAMLSRSAGVRNILTDRRRGGGAEDTGIGRAEVPTRGELATGAAVVTATKTVD